MCRLRHLPMPHLPDSPNVDEMPLESTQFADPRDVQGECPYRTGRRSSRPPSARPAVLAGDTARAIWWPTKLQKQGAEHSAPAIVPEAVPPGLRSQHTREHPRGGQTAILRLRRAAMEVGD